jgi:NTP pyrophosphatase (non-canonical NTP hydrolase)
MIRPELTTFVEHMEAALKANDHKGGWEEMSLFELIGRCRQEFFELEQALSAMRHDKSDVQRLQRVIEEAADVANFAMMIADNAARSCRIREAEVSA